MKPYKVIYYIKKGLPQGHERKEAMLIEAENATEACKKAVAYCRNILGFNAFRPKAEKVEGDIATKVATELIATYNELTVKIETSIKVWEIELQKAIKRACPNKAWWEVTECQIFMHLLENKTPSITVVEILEKLRTEEVENV